MMDLFTNVILRKLRRIRNTKINKDIYVCNTPNDIPSKFASGRNFYWDCEWQACYNEGDVFIKWVDDDENKSTELIGSNSAY